MKRYNVLVSTDMGSFIINKHDLGVGWQLTERGNYEAQEVQVLKSIASILRQQRADLVILDIGANIGVHSVALAGEVGPKGKILAFEAQRIVFNMLAGNIALNSIENVFCYHKALADHNGSIDIPQFDYGRPLSLGSVEFGGRQNEPIGQDPIDDPDRREQVECSTVDALGLPQVDLIKIDVEGMELGVLRGAAELVDRCRPIIQVEYLKGDREALKRWLKDRGYKVFVMKGNFLAIPEGVRIGFGGLEEV
jgi:FkbM family methyltransferase